MLSWLQGEASGDEGMAMAHDIMTRAYTTPGASVHWYGKASVEPRRKVGHINILGSTRAEARRRLEGIRPGSGLAPGEVGSAAAPQVAVIMGSDSDLPTMSLAAQVRPPPAPPNTTSTLSYSSWTPQSDSIDPCLSASGLHKRALWRKSLAYARVST